MSLIVRGAALQALADYPKAAPEAEAVESRSPEDLVHESTVAQIDYLVESGELKAEDVYAAESKAEKPRKGVLAKYAPEESESE